MPSNTAKGFPYPLGTDRVMDGDDAIHNLAQAVDEKVGAHAAGSTVVATVTSGTTATTVVTLPVGRFTVAPRVFLQQMSGIQSSDSTWAAIWPSASSTTAISVSCRRATVITTAINWYATNVDP